MYKVFINDSSLEFISEHTESENAITWSEDDKLEEWISRTEISNVIQHYILSCRDPDRLWREFMGFYDLIEAAGGVVRNNSGEVLMIYRLDKWDLPKGKLEEGETVEEGAVREVTEECGISHLEIVKALPITYHTYEIDGRRILKRTYWFSMRTEHQSELVPQIEEHIARAQWINPDFLDEYLGNTYASIKWLLERTPLTD